MLELGSFGLVCGKERVGGNKAEPGDQLGTYCTKPGRQRRWAGPGGCGEDHEKS